LPSTRGKTLWAFYRIVVMRLFKRNCGVILLANVLTFRQSPYVSSYFRNLQRPRIPGHNATAGFSGTTFAGKTGYPMVIPEAYPSQNLEEKLKNKQSELKKLVNSNFHRLDERGLN
jgi:hypothetical protein